MEVSGELHGKNAVPLARTSVTYWVGPSTSPNISVNSKLSCPCRLLNPESSSPQPWHYTDCATWDTYSWTSGPPHDIKGNIPHWLSTRYLTDVTAHSATSGLLRGVAAHSATSGLQTGVTAHSATSGLLHSIILLWTHRPVSLPVLPLVEDFNTEFEQNERNSIGKRGNVY
jgi:hypothetical protein